MSKGTHNYIIGGIYRHFGQNINNFLPKLTKFYCGQKMKFIRYPVSLLMSSDIKTDLVNTVFARGKYMTVL